MKLLQINVAVNSGSTGRIMEEIGVTAMNNGYESYTASGYIADAGSKSHTIKIGNQADRLLHGLKTRALDRHGFGSKAATLDLISKIRDIDPDVIGLHNLHGYYLNIDVLFSYLHYVQKPVVWTFHDCWPFTGHCSYFDRVDCKKWKTECHHCPMKTYYPASYGLDQSNNNFHDKKNLFTGLDNLTIVTPSHWLKGLVQQSFLKEYPVEVIHNGIDLEVFKPGTEHLPAQLKVLDKKIVLGVAGVWDARKGLNDFIKLSTLLPKEYQIVLVGLSESQLKSLPKNIIGIARTENAKELATLYSAAEVFVNPTYSDNFPTTNIEALACGTPVITYDTGGSPEAIDELTGVVVSQGDQGKVVQAVERIKTKGIGSVCRERAIEYFDKKDRFQDYLELYEYKYQLNE